MKSADALIVRSATKVTKELLNQAPNLKIVGRAGVGLDNIDLNACKNRNIRVVNSPEGPSTSVAELTLGLIITASRKFGLVYHGTKEGRWPKKYKGRELFGKKLGIIGSGAIGGLLAKYCIALGMDVLAYDIVKIPELENLDRFNYVSFDKLLSYADIISIHVPLLPDTENLLNKSAFMKMKKGVIIVNTARGGIIDENALLEAIDAKIVAGAALDVFKVEPVVLGDPILSSPHIFTTPHIGAQTIEAGEKNARIVCEKIIDFFE